ncbi:MAG: DNA repair protein RadC [Dysgonamonadaceae bacterium]|jgi:DNA repair protein RadC|nr:DNA repair protein RadC [Dysgonamonadaceae bacterium]
MTDLTKFTVKDWSPDDRPREKLLQNGVSALSDAELLAIIIGSGSKNETVVALSQRILHSVRNNINQLGKLSVNYLITNFRGIGTAKAVSIVAALELGRRRKAEEANIRNKITSSKDIYNYFLPLLGDLPHEEFWTLFLNRRNDILSRFKLSQGGVSETVVDGKLIYREAILCLASKVIICHNHPSGIASPSDQDDGVTLRIRRGIELLDMEFLDHVILANGQYYSYADEGRF